jgi:hypothetical protein
MVPDVDEAFLKHFLGPVPASGYTYGNGKQFRGTEPVEFGERPLIAKRAPGQQA